MIGCNRSLNKWCILLREDDQAYLLDALSISEYLVSFYWSHSVTHMIQNRHITAFPPLLLFNDEDASCYMYM